jgi:hypothetical protein
MQDAVHDIGVLRLDDSHQECVARIGRAVGHDRYPPFLVEYDPVWSSAIQVNDITGLRVNFG